MSETDILYCRECIDDINAKVERIDHAIRGNGKEGLVTTVALLDRRVSEFEEFVHEVKSLRRWVMFGMLSFMASLIWRTVESSL